jgi:YHS domain-containing protein
MELKVKEGRYLQTGLLTYNASDKKFHLAAMMPEGQSREYQGELLQERKLVLTSKPSQDEGQHRLTIQLRHEDRLLLLMEAKSAGQGSFARVAEVGYTRKGGSFARAANAGPKCIVTDGRGSIAVDYKGKTYYVCCSGCKTAFLDDPEGIIAEAAQRAKQNQDSRN